jgi:hypothetical protein
MEVPSGIMTITFFTGLGVCPIAKKPSATAQMRMLNLS